MTFRASVPLIAGLFLCASATNLAAQEIFNVRERELSEKEGLKWWSEQFSIGNSVIKENKLQAHQFLMFPDESQDEMAAYRALYEGNKSKFRKLGIDAKIIRGVISEAALKADLPDSSILEAAKGDAQNGFDDFSRSGFESVQFVNCVAAKDRSPLWQILEKEAASKEEIQASQSIVEGNMDCARSVGLSGLTSTELRLAIAEVLYVRRAISRLDAIGQEAAQ